MDAKSVKRVIDDLYQGIDGFKISSDAQKKLSYYYIGMIYDEVKTESFCRILDRIKPTKGKTFYDLGSGIGKKVFIASLYGEFSKSIGIENISGIYHTSKGILESYSKSKFQQSSSIQFIHADINEYDFTDGDVFYLSLASAAIEIELTGRLGHKLNLLKKGVEFITTGFPFISSYYSLLGYDTCDFSKEESIVFFHKKIE